VDTRFDYTFSDIHARIAEMDNDDAAPRRGFFIVALCDSVLFAMHNDVARCLPVDATRMFMGVPAARGYWMYDTYGISVPLITRIPAFETSMTSAHTLQHHVVRYRYQTHEVVEDDVCLLARQFRELNVPYVFKVHFMQPLPQPQEDIEWR
jgi:hypothetical protein